MQGNNAQRAEKIPKELFSLPWLSSKDRAGVDPVSYRFTVERAIHSYTHTVIKNGKESSQNCKLT